MAERVTGMDLFSRVFGSPWVYWPMCAVGVALVALAVLGPEARRRVAMEHHCVVMEAEVEALRRTRDELTAAAKALESDPAYAERVVRHDLKMVRPGETPLPAPGTRRTGRQDDERLQWQVPAVVAMVAPWADRPWRFGALASGVCLLAAGVIFSLPGRTKSRPQDE